MKPKSWVWQYAYREGDIAFCYLCSHGKGNTFSCRGGTTGSLGRHLRRFHGISNTEENLFPTDNSITDDTQNTTANEESSLLVKLEPSTSKKRKIHLRSDDKDNTFSDATGLLGQHLQTFYGITKTEENVFHTDNGTVDDAQNTAANEEISLSDTSESSTSKIRKVHTRRAPSPTNLCSSLRMEEIHQALAKMIALNQMPLSFCSSKGFLQFMAVVEPNYSPVKEEAIKKRLQALRQNIESVIKEKIGKASGVSCTSDCWPSAAQASHMTMTAHLIDDDWVPRSFTLETSEIDTPHNAGNLGMKMEKIFQDWGLCEKVMAVVTENAANLVKAVESMEHVQKKLYLTCTAHSLQLAVKTSISSEHIQSLIEKGSKIVGYFEHSNVAKYALEEKQKQLGLPVLSLSKFCNTKWNSIVLMLQRLIKNRGPVVNVLADRTVLSSTMATKLEASELEWKSMEELANILEPIQMLTNVLSNEDSSASMVRPLMYQLLEKHMVASDNDSDMINNFKGNFSKDLRQRMHLQWDHTSSYISTRQIASLLDPRYKDLEHESYDARAAIRDRLKQLLKENAPTENTAKNMQTTEKTALEFLYKNTDTNQNDFGNQLVAYLGEPQLRFDMSPYEWWKYKEDKYPAIALLARSYLCIQATSISSERCSSTIGNAFKNTPLRPENVDLLAFLYQNRKMFLELDDPISLRK